jgi:RNA 2',3'-cyclic 3'-phosphodiesterase
MSHRLFVAIAPPVELREHLAGSESGLRGARWIAADNIHLTLRFIGEVDGAQARDIDEALSGLHAAPFSLSLGQPGAFGPARRLRSLHIAVAATANLSALRQQVVTRLATTDVELDGRKFSPHITLARLKGADPEAVGQQLSLLAEERWGGFMVEEMVLFESHLGAGGAEYARAAVYPLRG